MPTRTLYIDFNIYTDNDMDFKQELIVLMIDNLRELKHACSLAAELNNQEIFLKICHKVKTTLFMLGDMELNAVVEDLRILGLTPDRISLLNKLSAAIITSLTTEKG